MPNPLGSGTSPVYYGVPDPHKHRNFDKHVKVYHLLKNIPTNKAISLDDFIQGIKNGSC